MGYLSRPLSFSLSLSHQDARAHTHKNDKLACTLPPNPPTAPSLVEDAVDGIAEELHHGVGGTPERNLAEKPKKPNSIILDHHLIWPGGQF